MAEITPMQIRDSRRLTGPNLIWNEPGAVLDVTIEGRDAGRAIRAWEKQASRVLDAVGWKDERTCARVQRDGLLLAMSAPMDALYAATEINEWAWTAASAVLDGGHPPSLDDAIEKLLPLIREERNPALIALQHAAGEHGVAFLTDDDFASVGYGRGSRTWPVDALPGPADVPWSEIHDVPVALITGTNGKTTTVRLLASIAEAAGQAAGMTSTDGIVVAGEIVEPGDYSGPGGGRKLLRDARVDVAFLETARGGMLRRGLTVRRAQAALITNVAEDHLGEHGVYDANELANAKWVISRAIGPEGTLVLNADEPRLCERAKAFTHPVTWFSVSGECEGDTACILEDDALVLRTGEERRVVAPVSEVPITLGGAARHNVANALAAIGVAHAMGYSIEHMRAGLCRFISTPDRNPGRTNLYEVNGARILVDFAHNPHGMAAIVDTARRMQAKRRLVVLGQAGDRDDEAIRDLVREAWQLKPDRVIVKDMDEYLRGREHGEVPAVIIEELQRLGAAAGQVVRVPDEQAAVRDILAWVQPGDLALLPVHTDRTGVFAMLGGESL